MATTWLIRTGGADTNGGTSATVRSTGTDGIAVTGDLTKFSSIGATWAAGDVGHGIYASGGTISRLISAVQVSQTATGTTTNTATTLTSSAAFNSTMLHCAVSGPGIAAGTYISAYNSTSSLTLSAASGAGAGTGTITFGPLLTTTGTTNFTNGTGQTWNVGGAFASWTRVFVTASGGKNVIAAGDSIYVGAGVYRTTVANTLSGSAGNVISIIGDVDGAKTGDAGQVTLTAFTTNDTTAPSATTLLALAATTNLTFQLLTFIGGDTGSTVTSTAAAAAANYTFTDCTFNGLSNTSAPLGFTSSTTGLALGVTIDRCFVIAQGAGISFSAATTASGSADFDLLCVVRNCQIFTVGGYGIRLSATGSAAFNPGGVRVYNCTVYGGAEAIQATPASRVSTTIPMACYNSILISAVGLTAGTSGQLVENYNLIMAATLRTLVSAGANSQTNAYAPLMEFGQSQKWAGVVRPMFAPDGSGSPLLGFGSNGSGGNYPTVDFLNRAKPSGGKSSSNSIGYMEFHDFSVQDTVTYPTGQTSSAKMTGPGDTDIWVPVDAVAVVLAIQLYQNAGYTGTTYATAQIIANGEIGVVANTQTCSSSTGSWQTLTFPSQTPAAAGWVKVRVSSFDTSGTGVLYFGALTAT